MSYEVMAREFRPQTFRAVVAQEHIIETLQNAIRQDRVAHAYLFSGPRGTGKTTTARLLAKALNCVEGPTPDPCGNCQFCESIAKGNSADVREIDGASTGSVDDIRQLREEVGYASTKNKRKIYIIDEVHMLSNEAFNALLKTLEEPPPHVIFVFATTEPQKVPETVLSRCQRFNFRRIAAVEIVGKLKHILSEKLTDTDDAALYQADEEALYQIARKADGGMRDAESLLDQVVAFSNSGVTVEAVQDLLGIIPRELYFDLTLAIQNKVGADALGVVERLAQEGGDIAGFVEGLMEHFRHLLVACAVGELNDDDLPESDRKRYMEAAAHFDETDLVRMLNTVSELETRIGRVAEPRFWLELTVMKLVKMAASVDLATVLAKLEEMGQGGGSASPAAPAPRSAPSRPQRKPEPSAPQSNGPQIQTPPPQVEAERSPVSPQKTSPVVQVPPRIEEPPPIGAIPQGTPPVAPHPEPEAAPSEMRGEPPSFDAVTSRWEHFVKEVKGRKISVGTFLSEGYAKSIDGEQLVVAFKKNKDFHANQVRRNRALVEEVAASVFGGVVRIACEVDYDSPSEDEGSEGDPQIEDDERVQMVLQVFGGEVVR